MNTSVVYVQYTCTCTIHNDVRGVHVVTCSLLMTSCPIHALVETGPAHWVTSFITSRPVCVYSCSQLRELWFNDLFMYMYMYIYTYVYIPFGVVCTGAHVCPNIY